MEVFVGRRERANAPGVVEVALKFEHRNSKGYGHSWSKFVGCMEYLRPIAFFFKFHIEVSKLVEIQVSPEVMWKVGSAEKIVKR